MMKKFRKFGGKRYKIVWAGIERRRARALANKYRAAGVPARVLTYMWLGKPSVYYVYARLRKGR
mgnify:CR=1 FL=1